MDEHLHRPKIPVQELMTGRPRHTRFKKSIVETPPLLAITQRRHRTISHPCIGKQRIHGHIKPNNTTLKSITSLGIDLKR